MFRLEIKGQTGVPTKEGVYLVCLGKVNDEWEYRVLQWIMRKVPTIGLVECFWAEVDGTIPYDIPTPVKWWDTKYDERVI